MYIRRRNRRCNFTDQDVTVLQQFTVYLSWLPHITLCWRGNGLIQTGMNSFRTGKNNVVFFKKRFCTDLFCTKKQISSLISVNYTIK